MWYRGIFCVALICWYQFGYLNAEENSQFFLKASKSVPRIGRNNNNKNNADFEKFFLKASKSVPRIGRRNEVPEEDDAVTERRMKYPTWSDLANDFEYYPELFNPETLEKLEKELGDDPSVYEWDKVRLKRNIPPRFMM